MVAFDVWFNSYIPLQVASTLPDNLNVSQSYNSYSPQLELFHFSVQHLFKEVRPMD